MQKVIVILGATATGKSTLAAKLANDINAEIISTDAFQIYQELNAGVNKISKKIREKIPHHFIDSLSIYDAIDIKIFQDLASKKIKEIANRNKNIIITGGSNLYLDALIKNYDLSKANDRSSITYFDHMEYDEIYDYLMQNDPEEALKISKQNVRRIIRAAQLFYATNKTKKAQNSQTKLAYKILFINTTLDREILYKKINDRVDKMLIGKKWINEVKNLYQKDKNIGSIQALKAIGYQEVLNHIITGESIDVEGIKKLTRNYAKRQITWNKRYAAINYDINKNDYQILLGTVKEFLNK